MSAKQEREQKRIELAAKAKIVEQEIATGQLQRPDGTLDLEKAKNAFHTLGDHYEAEAEYHKEKAKFWLIVMWVALGVFFLTWLSLICDIDKI